MSTKEIKWTMFVIAAIGNFIAMLDSTTVNLALYPMSVDLNVTMSQIQWVMVAYMLVLTVFLPFFGKLGDIFPKNKLYSIGFSIFAIGAFLNTTAPSFGLLVAYRCLEALGASIMLSNAQAIIAGIFKNERRGKVYLLIHSAGTLYLCLAFLLLLQGHIMLGKCFLITLKQIERILNSITKDLYILQ